MQIYHPDGSRQAGRQQVSRRAGGGEVRPLPERVSQGPARDTEEKLTTQALEELVEGDLNYKLVRRRRSEA